MVEITWTCCLDEYASIRAGRANPHVLDTLTQLIITAPRPRFSRSATSPFRKPRMIVIQPWERSLFKEIEKAILASDLGINPNNDGNVHPPCIPGTDRGAQ